MNASFLATLIPSDLWTRKESSQTNESISISRANTITANLAKILDRVDPSEYSELVAYLNKYPESEPQLNLLLAEVDRLSHQFEVNAEEIVIGTTENGETVLDLYIRVAEDFESYEIVKRQLRDNYSQSQSIGKRHVFPVVLRRIVGV